MDLGVQEHNKEKQSDGFQLYTPKDIQRIFGMGKDHTYALIKSNGFPTIKINNRFYVEKEALLKWIYMQQGRKYTISI